MKTATRLFALAVLLSSTFFVSSSFACSILAWDDSTAGTSVGSPGDTIARVSGLCGLEVTGNGYVTDNSPADEAKFLARFYFYPHTVTDGTTYQIFRAYSDESGAEVFRIEFDGSNVTLNASAAGGDSATAALDPGHWNQVEFAWESGQTGLLWVNRDAAELSESDTFASGTGAINQVRMGAVGGIDTDALFFDDYESHRSLPVGALLVGDSNNDGMVNALDISGILKEANAFTPVVQSGTPDCNLDGSVNALDISGILKAADAFSPIPCGS